MAHATNVSDPPDSAARTPGAGQASRSARRWLVWLPILAIALGAAGAAGWWAFASRPARGASGAELGTLVGDGASGPLNLLFITLDTTRADAGRLRRAGRRTPALDRLAREGVLFERAVAVAPLTLPAHATIFTGKFPPKHGVRDNGGYFLDADQLTLAGLLKPRGCRRAPSSRPSCSTPSGGSTRASTRTSTISTWRSTVVSRSATIQRPGDRGRRRGAAVDPGGVRTRRSSRGSISTTRTRRTSARAVHDAVRDAPLPRRDCLHRQPDRPRVAQLEVDPPAASAR